MEKAKYLVWISLMMGMMVSCNKVDLPIPEPVVIEGNDSVSFPTADTTAMNRDYKKTYIEEYTGHKCITCPPNTRFLLQQQADNKERMIVLSIHAGLFALVDPPKYPTDFNTPYGTELFQHFNMAAQAIPSVIINRHTFPSFNDQLIFSSFLKWTDPIDEENTNTSTDFAIGLAADYIDSLDLFYIKASTEVLNTVDEDYRLLILCVEDSVIAPQLDQQADESEHPDKIVKDYAHRHVLRAKLSTDQSLSGDPLITGGAEAGTWIDYELNANMPDNVVNPEKTHIIAVIANPDTEEILQSEEVHVHVK